MICTRSDTIAAFVPRRLQSCCRNSKRGSPTLRIPQIHQPSTTIELAVRLVDQERVPPLCRAICVLNHFHRREPLHVLWRLPRDPAYDDLHIPVH